jgi:rubrerythrin
MFLFIFYYDNNMSSETGETELTDTAYDILKVLGKDADFIYDTIETYIRDAQKANKPKVVEMWQTIKQDRKRHMHMLKEALEEEIHG